MPPSPYRSSENIINVITARRISDKEICHALLALITTVFPRINAPDVYLRIKNFRGRLFQISKIVETEYGHTK